MPKIHVFLGLSVILAAFIAIFSPAYIASAQTLPVPTGINLSIQAWNDTQNQDASKIKNQREDFITFKIMVVNTGTLAQNFTPEVDLDGFLPLVDLVDLGGASLQGQTLRFPTTNLQPGQSRQNQFRARIKYSLPPFRYAGSVKFGNTLQLEVASLLMGGRDTKYVAPETGANFSAFIALLFGSGFATALFAIKGKRIHNI